MNQTIGTGEATSVTERLQSSFALVVLFFSSVVGLHALGVDQCGEERELRSEAQHNKTWLTFLELRRVTSCCCCGEPARSFECFQVALSSLCV